MEEKTGAIARAGDGDVSVVLVGSRIDGAACARGPIGGDGGAEVEADPLCVVAAGGSEHRSGIDESTSNRFHGRISAHHSQIIENDRAVSSRFRVAADVRRLKISRKQSLLATVLPKSYARGKVGRVPPSAPLAVEGTCTATVEVDCKLRAWLWTNCHAKRLECVELAPALRQRQQAGRIPNASRNSVAPLPPCTAIAQLARGLRTMQSSAGARTFLSASSFHIAWRTRMSALLRLRLCRAACFETLQTAPARSERRAQPPDGLGNTPSRRLLLFERPPSPEAPGNPCSPRSEEHTSELQSLR